MSHRSQSQLRATIRQLDNSIPPILRPLIRAYLLGYASAVAPRALTVLLQHLSRKKHAKDSSAEASTLHALLEVIRKGFDPQRFPAFCAVLVGGSTLLQIPTTKLLDNITGAKILGIPKQTLSRWLATLVASWLSLRLLQSKQSPAFVEIIGDETTSKKSSPRVIKFGGRTLDLTLFSVVRAVDVLVGALWGRRKASKIAKGEWSKIDMLISRLTDPAVFAISSALIMWSWFYLPARLPKSYNKWITSAAAVDSRLIEALRRMRAGDMHYGIPNGQESLLQPMCEEYNLPVKYGDPATAVPFPCELVHMGCGPSCEYHAASRFLRSFKWAMATYLPLTLVLHLRRAAKADTTLKKRLLDALLSASRSSAFLGSFIALFYYGVCLARTKLGPYILGTDIPARVQIDSGLCVGSGCALCGWSIMLEKAGRQQDIALFVAPRALATFFPRRYKKTAEWKETLAFSLSTAIVFTSAMERKESVRGVLGKLLTTVLEQ